MMCVTIGIRDRDISGWYKNEVMARVTASRYVERRCPVADDFATPMTSSARERGLFIRICFSLIVYGSKRRA